VSSSFIVPYQSGYSDAQVGAIVTTRLTTGRAAGWTVPAAAAIDPLVAVPTCDGGTVVAEAVVAAGASGGAEEDGAAAGRWP